MGISTAFSKSIKNVLHWMGAVSFISAYLTADSESFRLVHVYSGYGFGMIFLLRLCWGAIAGGASSLGALWRRATIIKGIQADIQALAIQRLWSWNRWYGAFMGIFILVMYGLTPLLVLTGIGGYEEWGGKWLRGLFENTHEVLAEIYVFMILAHLAWVAVRFGRMRWQESRTTVGEKGINRDGMHQPLSLD